MPAKNKPAANIKTAAPKQTNYKQPVEEQENLPALQLKNWCDKQVIMQTLGIKDASLKNLRKCDEIVWSTLIGKIYYFIPSFLALLEKNMKGKMPGKK